MIWLPPGEIYNLSIGKSRNGDKEKSRKRVYTAWEVKPMYEDLVCGMTEATTFSSKMPVKSQVLSRLASQDGKLSLQSNDLDRPLDISPRGALPILSVPRTTPFSARP